MDEEIKITYRDINIKYDEVGEIWNSVLPDGSLISDNSLQEVKKY